MNFKYLITDVDGVIFDRMPVYLSAITEVLKPFGFSKEAIRSYFYGSLGTPVGIQIKGILNRSGFDIGDGQMERMLKEFWAISAGNKTNLFPGVKETLEEMKSQGLFIMASSGSNTDEIGRSFKEHGLPYDFYLGSDQVLKGDEHIKIFAGNFSLDLADFCRQAIFIGDGTTDMQIASRNGIFGIGITNTIPAEDLLSAGAKAVISNISELSGYLRQEEESVF
ncbi:MAG: HAD hydrolase-like protein [Candidatus Paceibacterota bacterium]|jgi:phosphoglycolate phosphatase-like HAD superfamily hydrolase